MNALMTKARAWATAACVVGALAPALAAQLGGQVEIDEPSGPLRLGPVAGITTAWHDAPAIFAVPLGTRLEFDVPAPAGALVSWDGVVGANTDGGLCVIDEPGRHKVTVKVVAEGITTYESQVVIQTLATTGSGLTIDVQPVAESIFDDRIVTNQHTMDAFFSASIAELSQLGEGHYATSVGKPLSWRARIEPEDLAPLLEWRVDGEAVSLGTQLHASIDEIGSHRISVGPPEQAARVDLDTYAVEVHPLFSFTGVFPENIALPFLATTEPAGFENLVTWLASTKHGTAYPATGSGPIFSTTFSSTAGPAGMAWSGVKGDQHQLGGDGPPPPPPQPTVQSVSPPSGGGGTVCVVTATNLAANPIQNVCIRSGATVLRINQNGPPSVIGATYPIPPNAVESPLTIMNGSGQFLPSSVFQGPAFSDVLIPEDTRIWQSDGSSVGTSSQTFTPNPTIGAIPFTTAPSSLDGTPGLAVSLTIPPGECAIGDCLWIYAFLETEDSEGNVKYGELEPCAIQVTGSMDSNDCAIFLCSFLKEAYSGVVPGLVCSVGGTLGDTVTITIPTGLGILDWGGCLFVGPCNSFPTICP